MERNSCRHAVALIERQRAARRVKPRGHRAYLTESGNLRLQRHRRSGLLKFRRRFSPIVLKNSCLWTVGSANSLGHRSLGEAKMGELQTDQAALFSEFSLEWPVSTDHKLRAIDRLVDLESVWTRPTTFYSSTGRPSIDPELLIRILIVGSCFGIRSERRLC
jgi:hypothetical protein